MIELMAPAKLTLSLRITGVRADGFHLIDAEMVSLDLCDRLVVGESTETVVEISGPGAGTLAGRTDGSDLVSAALGLAGRTARVEVHKRIPAGAGLGGGSSDAAAILRWCGYTDLVGAAGIGADIAYCMVGGRCRVQGIGERVESLPAEPRTLTLLTPSIHCSTPAVYRRWDAMGGPVAEGPWPNDLEAAALAEYPGMARARDLLGDATGLTPRLAGSGSTWFVEGSFPGDGRLVTRTI
ncbi:MAG: 4-(cytidine 5'-diphospho)-2-C-methyl-D-erythritol kinase [Microthrixaceae bacterium]